MNHGANLALGVLSGLVVGGTVGIAVGNSKKIPKKWKKNAENMISSVTSFMGVGKRR